MNLSPSIMKISQFLLVLYRIPLKGLVTSTTSLRDFPWDQTSTPTLLTPFFSMTGTAALISHQMRVRSGKEEGIFVPSSLLEYWSTPPWILVVLPVRC